MLKKSLARLAGALRKPDPEPEAASPSSDSLPRAVAPEQPLLWVATAGFDPAQKDLLERQLAGARSEAPRWEAAAFAEADAWLISGLKAWMLGDHSLKVEPAVPQERSLQINLQMLDRPTACSLPLLKAQPEEVTSFVLTDEGIAETLGKFENALQPLLAQYALGCLIAGQPRSVRTGVFHLAHDGNLIATLDFQGLTAGIALQASATDIYACQWERKALSAGRPPPSFQLFAIGELTWLYVLRSKRDLLPSRYRARKIFFRHHPQVRSAWLRNTHRVVLQELTAEAFTFERLRQRTSLPPGALSHALACLYHTGAITTSRGKAHSPVLSESHAFETQSPPSADMANSVFFKN